MHQKCEMAFTFLLKSKKRTFIALICMNIWMTYHFGHLVTCRKKWYTFFPAYIPKVSIPCSPDPWRINTRFLLDTYNKDLDWTQCFSFWRSWRWWSGLWCIGKICPPSSPIHRIETHRWQNQNQCWAIHCWRCWDFDGWPKIIWTLPSQRWE